MLQFLSPRFQLVLLLLFRGLSAESTREDTQSAGKQKDAGTLICAALSVQPFNGAFCCPTTLLLQDILLHEIYVVTFVLVNSPGCPVAGDAGLGS